MKLLTYKKRNENHEEAGVLCRCGKAAMGLQNLGLPYRDMNELIETANPKDWEKLKKASLLSSLVEKTPEMTYLENVSLCAPIPYPRQDIICLGINYMAHAEESARYKAETFGGERPYAVYFSKRVNEAVADGGEIQSHGDIDEKLDYEAELAVIIGRDAKNVSPEQALDYVLGYTILNDVSARELQSRHKQWYFGKSLDGFCPMGPWIVTADEIPDPHNLSISSLVNGELRQNSSTSQLIFNINHVISELSSGMTLKAGSIIAMGTPAGVGMGFVPPKFLKSGDTVECAIESIGSLIVTIK